MFIGVKHQINDPKAFWGKAEEKLPKLPDGFKVIAHVASKDGKSAFCLWECESVDKLKGFMEPIWGGALARNEYFEADTANCSGVPVPAAK